MKPFIRGTSNAEVLGLDDCFPRGTHVSRWALSAAAAGWRSSKNASVADSYITVQRVILKGSLGALYPYAALRDLLVECRSMLYELLRRGPVSFRWISRNVNTVADALSKLAAREHNVAWTTIPELMQFLPDMPWLFEVLGLLGIEIQG